MESEENYFDDKEEIEDQEDNYKDQQEESKNLKTHSPKKRWKERHSYNKDSSHRSPRRSSDDKDSSRRSSGESSNHQHHHRTSDECYGEDFHTKSSSRHDDEDRYLKSKQKRLMEKLRKIEAEDGEILEDGEIDDGDEHLKGVDEEMTPQQTDSNENIDGNLDYNNDSGGEIEEDEEGSYNNNDDSSKKKDKHDKKRKHQHRDKRDKRKKDDHYKKKKRRPDYVDHDKVADEEMQQTWPGGSKKQSPKGFQRQESYSSHRSPGSGGRGGRGGHGNRRDRDRDRRDRGRGRRDRRNRHDHSNDSPPGMYDSPSYDEDSQEEYQDEGYSDKRKQNNRKSMMSLMQGDEYIDANVAADEGENLYKKREGGKKQKKQNYLNKRKFDRQHSEQPTKKKPLLETPMDERPVCRFYKEGKCHKGADCPFNHEMFQKKPELCKYYLGGSCSKGNDCIFMHSEYPCKFYHTGQECYQGDNCKFSHDEPTEETEEIIERMNSRDQDHHDHHGGHEENEEEEDYEDYGQNRQKAGVLGSPPRHLKDQMIERIKKIPSLFDIQTFPPGQSPQKPQQGGPMNNSPQRMQGPNQGQPSRPVGFYSDTMQGMRGPPPMGIHGPMNMGLQGMNGPGQMGPPGPRQCAPGQMQGPRNMPPNSMGHGPGQMNIGPPNSMGPMGGPMMQQGGVGIPMQPGQMGGPAGQGMPMNNPIIGPQGPMGGPQRMNNPNLNPALAIVGALLRHVNPNMAPQVSQALTVQGVQPDQRTGSGILSPNHPGIESNLDPRQGFKSPPLESRLSQDESYSPQDDGTDSNIDKQQRNEKQGDVLKDSTQDENEKKLAMMGLDLGSLSQLPAKQRELMMRLQQHGGQSETDEEKDTTSKRGRKDSCSSEETRPKNKVEDDNWYSSDEEEGSTPKLTDVLKNLTQKETPTSQTVPTSSSSSSINVMMMINAIKSQGPTPTAVPQVRDPRQRNIDPRSVSHGNDMGIPHPADPRTFTSGLTVPPIQKWNSEPAIINSRPGDAEWRCYRIEVDITRRTEPPQGINLLDPQFKNDPRIKKFLDVLNMKNHKENKNPHELSMDIKPVDPRSKPSALVIDPRIKKPGDTSADPRLQRTISENSLSRSSDPRTPPTGVHNLPIRPLPPSTISKPNDPRLSRQLSESGMVIKVPKPSDDKLLPISLAEIASPSPSDILASLQYPDIDIGDKKAEIKKSSSLEAQIKKEKHADEQSEQTKLENAMIQSEAGKKLDYRNDPRFKVKVKTLGDAGQRRFGGQRKGSMEYSSPLDAESDHRDNTGFNSYNRPAANPPIKQDPRLQKTDPHIKQETSTVGLPELPDFVPPSEENISTKKFFKQMDPTASPFC